MDDLVLQCSDRERTLPPIRLGYVDPPRRLRPVRSRVDPMVQGFEPALEVWSPDLVKRSEKRKYLSVWILIGGIWISATLVVAGATGAILYLLG